ncbi:hypothetical protein D3C87_1933240 [compost metagenome]
MASAGRRFPSASRWNELVRSDASTRLRKRRMMVSSSSEAVASSCAAIMSRAAASAMPRLTRFGSCSAAKRVTSALAASAWVTSTWAI